MNKRRVALVFFSILFLLGLLGLVIAVHDYVRSNEEYEKLAKEVLVTPKEEEREKGSRSIDFNLLQVRNKEVVAWIYIENTNIDYPVVRGIDNEYYLNHSFEKKHSKSGSLFLDCKSNGEFSETNAIIFGHNMKDGSMFADLKKFADSHFLEQKNKIYIYTTDGKYTYEAVSATVLKADDELYTNKYQKSKQGEERTVTLSTCTNNGKKRFAVILRLISNT